MAYNFTPGVHRALAAAAGWSSTGPDGFVLPVSSIEAVLGLLDEQECYAAKLLVKYGFDAEAVRRRYPELIHSDEHAASLEYRGLSAGVEASLRAACAHLDESHRSFQWATEHVLLGLALADDDVGHWLREQGLDAAAIERDQAARYGGDRSPLAVDFGPIPLAEVADEAPAAVVPHASEVQQPRMNIRGNGAAASNIAALRIVDAAANRAGEALRVVEDYVRFVLDDSQLMRLCKEFRHELTGALATVSLADRLAARDTAHDVGTGVSTASEMTRRDPADVATANLRRLQESLRSLEEFAKLLDPQVAARCEQLRYRSYELQRVVLAAGVHQQLGGRSRLENARLYVLVDGCGSAAEFESLVRTLVAAGVDVLQLRDKRLDDRTLLERAEMLRQAVAGSGTLFILNDRADLAVAAGADGVHVGQEELTARHVRAIVGPDMLVGVSTHSIEQARQAVLDGADYLGVGPTFPSGTKSFAAFPGLEFVRQIAAEIRLPAFAIGGITASNVGEVVQAGLRRVAVSGAIVQAADPAAAAIALRQQLEAAS
jgi:thiamine-phosphate pyrophosphorylase